MKIRPLAGHDAEQVKNISATAFVHDRYTIDPALPEDRVERAHRGWAGECCRFCDLVLVAECDRMIVGFCAVSYPQASPVAARQGIIQLIAVDRARHRRGIGAGLLGEAIGRLRGRADSAVIRTEASNAPALGLYRALGFEPYARFGYARFNKPGLGFRVKKN
ncbi:GNAT family N-acetyltransferase [Candidatus Uhrbacteria bacterium]|nr:GNAT family N-acetyltransferase [Candidatus Uhrbacteria bacterium]